MLDQIGPERRIDPDAPLVAAYLGGRPVVLARPFRPGPGEGTDFTVPITLSRLRRAIDIERGRDAGPYAPSMVEDFPLEFMPIAVERAGLGQQPEPPRTFSLPVFFGSVAASFALGLVIGRAIR